MRLVIPAAVALLAAASVGANAQKRADHNFDLQHVTWRIAMDTDEKMIFGDVTNRLAPLADNTREIVLDCGKLTIGRVTVDGSPTRFTVNNEKLSVFLPPNVRKGQAVDVRIVYAGQPEAGVYFIDARNAFPATTPAVYTQGEMEDTRYWIPTYDYPDDKATTEGYIEVPLSWNVVSNGRLVDVKRDRTNHVFHWKMDQPHSTYLISFVAGPYSVGHEEWSGIPVDWYVPTGLEEMGKTSFSGTADMVRFYSELTGFKYPYAKFAQAAVPDYMFGGMENITEVTQTIGTLHPPRTEPLASSKGLVLHELAHQWFGDTVTTPDWANIWINEGFASFLPHFYVRETEGQEAYDMGRYGTLSGAFGAISSGRRPMVWTGYELAIDAFDGNVYGGGAARMFMLMDLVGEQQFWKGIGDLFRRYAYKSVDTEQFFDSMSQSTGVDLSKFKQQWFYTAAAPDLTVRVDGANVVVTQHQNPPFELDVPLWILDGKNWVKRTIQLRSKETRMSLGGLANRPVLLDPEVKLLSRIRLSGYSNDWMLDVWRNAPNVAQKARLGEQMYGQLTGEQILALAKAERSKHVLINLMDAMQPSATSFLVEKSKDPDKEIQATAIRVLARLPKSETSVARLREIWNNDTNDVLRNDALRTLLQWTGDNDLAESAFKMDSHGDSYRVTVLNWWATTAPARAKEESLRALGAVQPPGGGGFGGRTAGSQPLQTTAIGILGRLKDLPGERRAYNALVAEVQRLAFGTRQSAINALVQYGDPAAIKFIEPITKHSLHFVRRNAQAAVASLRSKVPR
jgi:aminopeptidase N